ncbi:MAG: MBL fold metallo-hydrolase [Candidatus Marinimicrobia bacterium]|nr:MBL fold metallo-hydrolase [Candidatus Neomarinimicrobiota bacterium]MCK9483074.1 MBL fold metallo-hydrolase [Candidatus Neomarinimicrobiota bacterium]MCK9559239.1 MBL fold metallo-hydrolase [Candidatus Neomarinimicrobiota bacterium]MDD5061264.1 MBL fold metallo-hydrolase [Candidatus Neomarinimicrobiota bacterium]MDD5230442.1 MBL fold metallo-hydrolase [Candidatus Neomarinimicrobiota bacterium]
MDPFRIEGGAPADIILITHDHYDHFDRSSITKIHKAETIIIAPSSVCQQLSGDTRSIVPGGQITLDKVIIRAVPAYNIGKKFHPRENQNVGYLIQINNLTYYHAGDTDLTPEMKNIRADVAFLPVSGTYTMNAAEAAQAVKEIRPQVAVPIHWGAVCGTRADAEKFAQLADCIVVILNKGK